MYIKNAAGSLNFLLNFGEQDPGKLFTVVFDNR